MHGLGGEERGGEGRGNKFLVLDSGIIYREGGGLI